MIEFLVECDVCGTELSAELHSRSGGVVLYVDPCAMCMADAEAKAYDEGYDEGGKFNDS